EEFLEFTKSVWTFSAESAKKVGHPAPFPVELPLRAIKLYTFKDDVVLDPFMGSGQTAIAALKANRHYIGYDISKEYVTLAGKRIKRYLQEQITLFPEPIESKPLIISERLKGKGYRVKSKYKIKLITNQST
ncbi:MAG: site-specific DNA-methyltransferase, partial [Nitrospinota bacterium]